MPWIYIVIAGLLEVCWATGIKYTDGFTKPLPSILTGAGIVGSMWMLALAARALPIGTAYAAWVGIGAAGTILLGVLAFDEPISPARIAFLAMLVTAIVGLKMTSNAAH